MFLDLKLITNNYDEMFKDMKEGVNTFFSTFTDSPDNLSGWGHNYFCEIDGGKLLFKMDSPYAHKCEICGKVYNDEKYNKTWTYLYRYQCLVELIKSAALYKKTKEKKYLDYVTQTMSFYAENYEKFTLHAKDLINPELTVDVGGAGRIMPQGLNEAMFLIKMIFALEIVRDDLSEEFLSKMKNQLFKPAIESVLRPQCIRIHNIVCWINSAIGAAGIFFDERKWIEYAFETKWNIYELLEEGVTADKFWFEGSIHYNFFTLEGIIDLLLVAKHNEFKIRADKLKLVKDMLVNAYNYSFDNDVLPNPNDGWPNINLKTYLHIYNMAANLFENDMEFQRIVDAIESSDTKRGPLQLADAYFWGDYCLEKLLFDPVINRMAEKLEKTIYNYEHSKYAMIRNNRVNLFVKYGHNTVSHSHPDKMSFEATIDNKIITHDLSNAGYGCKLCNEWHRMTPSHNTIVVDGKNHTNIGTGGKVLLYDYNILSVRCDNVYEGVDFERTFRIHENQFEDIFNVTSKEEHDYDLFMHIDGDIIVDRCNLEEVSLDLNGYENEYIKNIRRVVNQRKLKFNIDNLKGAINVESNCEIYVCETMDNPVTKSRKSLVLRRRGANEAFKLRWEY